MFKKYLYLLATAVLIGFTGCEALDDLDKYPDPKIETSITYPINGEYFVTLDMLEGTKWTEDYYHAGYTKIMFSNTTANDPDMVWFDDLKFWPTKAKIKCDPANKKFLPGEYLSSYAEKFVTTAGVAAFQKSNPVEYKVIGNFDKNAVIDSILVSGYANKVKVLGGSIELGTYEADSKTKTDAITIEIEWSDDPGTKYRYKGYRSTGFTEDDH